MTPIPPDVAAAIVAAGHSLSAEPMTSTGYGRVGWHWSSSASVAAPVWRVCIGDAYGRGGTPRAALIDALRTEAEMEDEREGKHRAEAKRVRLDYRKAQATKAAETAAKRAADVRALAAQVAAMWPEVGP